MIRPPSCVLPTAIHSLGSRLLGSLSILCILATAGSAANYTVRDTLRLACPGQSEETFREGYVVTDPVGDQIFAANREQGNLAVLDPYTLEVVTCIETGHTPVLMTLDELHRRLYVMYYIVDEILVVDADTYAPLDTIASGNNPTALVVNPDTQKLYVSQYGDESIWVIDGVTGDFIKSIWVGWHPGTPSVSRTHNRIFVPTWGGYLTVIDGELDQLEDQLYLFGGICETEHSWVNEALGWVYVSPFNCPLMKVVDVETLDEVTTEEIWLSGYPTQIFGDEVTGRVFVPAETTMTVVGPNLTVEQVVPFGSYYGVHGCSHHATGRVFVESNKPPPPEVEYGLLLLDEESSDVADPGGSAEFLPALRHRPIPFQRSSIIHCSIPESGFVTLRVYDSAGRLVRRIFEGVARAGAVGFQWDGRDGEGRLAPSGVYFYRLQTSRQAVTSRDLLIR